MIANIDPDAFFPTVVDIPNEHVYPYNRSFRTELGGARKRRSINIDSCPMDEPPNHTVVYKE